MGPEKPAPDAIPTPGEPEMPPPKPEFPEIPEPKKPLTPFPAHPEPNPAPEKPRR
jgi:hypothetical protein